MVDIIQDAFTEGMRDFKFNLATNDFIRIMVHVVRKCDTANFDEPEARPGSIAFVARSVKNPHVTARNVKRVLSRESSQRASQ